MPSLELDVYTSPARDMANGGLFSPTVSTLVLGPSEAVLIDAQYGRADVAEVARRIDASGRTLTTIYITHPHADHYFGIETLLERYPSARAVARPQVVDVIREQNDNYRKQWREWFADATVDNTVVPEVLDEPLLTVDGHELPVLDVGQADIPNNTVVRIPDLNAIVTGDLVYNGVNPFLAETTPEQWAQWADNVDSLRTLEPAIVVAGHKQPGLPDDDLEATLGFTSSYVRDFINEAAVAENSRDLVTRMQNRYPNALNPSALILSSVLAVKRRTN